MTLMRKIRFVGELQFHWHSSVTIGEELFIALEGLELQQAVFVDVSIHIDGIDGDDGGEQRGACGDKVPRGGDGAADATCDGGLHLRVFHLDAGTVLGGLRGFERGQTLFEHALARFRLLRSDGFGGEKSRNTVELAFGGIGIGFSTLHLGLRGAEFGFKRPLVDGEEDVSLFHEAAGLEMHLGDVAGHSRAEIDHLGGFDTAGEFLPLDEFLRLHRSEAHWCGRHGTATVTAALGGLSASGEEQGEWEEDARGGHGECGDGGQVDRLVNLNAKMRSRQRQERSMSQDSESGTPRMRRAPASISLR